MKGGRGSSESDNKVGSLLEMEEKAGVSKARRELYCWRFLLRAVILVCALSALCRNQPINDSH